MKIYDYVPTDGQGVTACDLLRRIPDKTAELEDIKEALRWAERDNKVWKAGSYYWRIGK